MSWLNGVLLLYSILNIVMGFLGYAEKHSIPSVIAGTAAGMIVLGSVAWSKTSPRNARITALLVTFLLMGRFASKTFSENKLYPDGIMFVSSLAVALCLVAGHIIGMRAKKARDSEETKPH